MLAAATPDTLPLAAMQRLISRLRPLVVDDEELTTIYTERPRKGETIDGFLDRLLALHVWHAGDQVQATITGGKITSTTLTAVPAQTAGYGSAVVGAQSILALRTILDLLIAYGYGQLTWRLDATGTLRPTELVVQARQQDGETDQAFSARLRSEYREPLRRAFGAVTVLPAYDADGRLMTRLSVALT
jgi:hypothetical protein